MNLTSLTDVVVVCVADTSDIIAASWLELKPEEQIVSWRHLEAVTRLKTEQFY